MKAPKFISNIDFTELRKQKSTLLLVIGNMVCDNSNPEEVNKMIASERDDLDSILHLIDALQDCAVDEFGIPENVVFDSDEESPYDNGDMYEETNVSETPEEEFARTNAQIIFEMRIEGEGLYTDDKMPKEFIENIVDNPTHASLIKNLIRCNILNDVTEHPDNFNRDANGKLTYDASMSDYGFAIEEYCRERFREQDETEDEE